MMRPAPSRQKGSIVLVALCFVAVMAIAVTTYLTLSSRAMNLSARTFHTGLSAQLADIGVEQAMSALNNDSWTDWTTSGMQATRTHTPAASYGMGITASVKILLTNRFISNWRSATDYDTIGHMAWYRGQWYACISAPGQSIVPPADATANWTSAPGAWTATTPYAVGDIVTHNDTAYRCLLAHVSKAPPEATYWTTTNTALWSSSGTYSAGDTAMHGGTLYRCIASSSNHQPPNTTYWVGAPVIYVEGLATLPDGDPSRQTQLRAEVSPAALFPNAVGASNATTSVNFASSGTIESYNSNTLQHVLWSGSTSYVAGDTVYHPASGQYYRSLVAHSNQNPVVSGSINFTYWTPAVTSYATWDSSLAYVVGDMVTRTGKLYRCTADHSNREPGVHASWYNFWVQQMDIVAYKSSTTYSLNDLATNSAGTVYRSKQNSNSNNLLTNTTWWEVHDNLGTYTTTWSTGTSYAVGDLVCSAGIYYQCIEAHTSNNGGRIIGTQRYWAMELVGYPQWVTGVAYAVGNVVFYQPPDAASGRQSSGMLYRCRTANTGKDTPTIETPAYTGTSASTKWEVGSVDYATWTSTTGFRVGDITFYPVTGLLYRCKVAHTNQAPASTTVTNTTYWAHTGRAFTPWSSGTAYSAGDITISSAGVVYRCIQSHSNQAPPNGSYWTEIGTDFPIWSNTTAYQVGDIVYRTTNGTVYRCIQAHTGQTPPNATYWSTAMSGYSAVVAAPAVVSSSTTIVRGYVNATTTSFGSNAIVQGPTSPASPKVDQSRVGSNSYVPQFDPPASYAALSGPGADLPDSEGNNTILFEGARTLGAPGATSPSVYNITGIYTGGSTSSSTSGLYLDESRDVLTIVGPVILNVSGILYTNSGRIVVAPTGSLEIYFNGSQLYIGNNTANTGGGIINQTFNPAKMLLVSASTQNSSSYHYFWSRQPYHGLIYMPSAYLHKWNSGFPGEIYGAVSAKTVYFNHPANVDYDLALRTVGSTGTYIGSTGTYIERPFAIHSWRELTDPAERISF